MKALRFNTSGKLEHLNLADMPIPTPQSGEVVVRIKAAGLNTSDVSNVMGNHPYTTLPRTPGRDFAGVVCAGPAELLGREVWGTGKEFGFTRDGSHAEYVCAPTDGVAPKPRALSFAQAAACGVPLTTAWTALQRCSVGPGCRLLVLAATGGVGSMALSLGRWLGAEVTAAVRNPEQAANLESRGVPVALLSGDTPLGISLQEFLGAGFDVVFDGSGALLAEAVPLLAPFGRIAVIVRYGDGKVNVPVRDLYRRAGSIVGINSLLYGAAECAGILSRLQPAFDAGQLMPPAGIEGRPLARGVETYADLGRGARCKFVFVAE